jgi:hypothetical protein
LDFLKYDILSGRHGPGAAQPSHSGQEQRGSGSLEAMRWAQRVASFTQARGPLALRFIKAGRRITAVARRRKSHLDLLKRQVRHLLIAAPFGGSFRATP